VLCKHRHSSLELLGAGQRLTMIIRQLQLLRGVKPTDGLESAVIGVVV
jgi:hypothetical protein